MKLKYVEATGEIICMGEMPDLEGAVEVSFPIPSEPLNYFTFNGTELVRKEQSVIDAMLAIQNFDFKKLWGVVWAGALSPVGLVELPPYQSAIEAMWNYPNRSAIYPYMQALVAAGKGNASDLQIIIDAFAAQNIDITTVQ
jgi:hypothetical protein